MSARSLSGIGFNSSPAYPRGGFGAAKSINARKAGVTHAAAPFKIVYEIAPNRIPVRDHLHGMGFAYGGGDSDMDMGGGGSDGGYDGYFTNDGGGGGWDGWGPTFTGDSGIYIGGGSPGPITNNSGGGGGYPSPPSGRSGSTGGGSGTPGTFRAPSSSRNPADIVNAIEPLLKQNLINFKTGDRSAASKQAALNYFDAAWSYVQQQCGTACTTDRQAGACKWRRGSGDPMEQYDGIKPGECFNWVAGYRDPIARDPGVATSIFGGTTAPGQIIPGVNLGSNGNLLLIGAAVIFLLVAVGGKH